MRKWPYKIPRAQNKREKRRTTNKGDLQELWYKLILTMLYRRSCRADARICLITVWLHAILLGGRVRGHPKHMLASWVLSSSQTLKAREVLKPPSSRRGECCNLLSLTQLGCDQKVSAQFLLQKKWKYGWKCLTPLDDPLET